MFRINDEDSDERGIYTLFQVVLMVIIMFILALHLGSKPQANPQIEVSSGDFSVESESSFYCSSSGNF
jgi:hypothetical protein